MRRSDSLRLPWIADYNFVLLHKTIYQAQDFTFISNKNFLGFAFPKIVYPLLQIFRRVVSDILDLWAEMRVKSERGIPWGMA